MSEPGASETLVGPSTLSPAPFEAPQCEPPRPGEKGLLDKLDRGRALVDSRDSIGENVEASNRPGEIGETSG